MDYPGCFKSAEMLVCGFGWRSHATTALAGYDFGGANETSLAVPSYQVAGIVCAARVAVGGTVILLTPPLRPC